MRVANQSQKDELESKAHPASAYIRDSEEKLSALPVDGG